MKRNYGKIILASGFLVLLTFLITTIVFILIEHNLLLKENEKVFPAKQRFTLNSCHKGSDVAIRSFPFVEKKTESIPILMYHHIVKKENLHKLHMIDGELNPMIVLKDDFEEQMAYLHEHGYVTLTMNELYSFLVEDIDIPSKSVVLTFDDGYKDNFIEAYPILKNYGFKAVNFVITGAITKRSQPFDPKHVQYLSIKEMVRACEVFEYQSHTYNLHQSENTNQGQGSSYLISKSNDEILHDIETSIYHLNGENIAFAYPYGEYLPSTIGHLKKLGFKMAFTTENRVTTREDHLYEIPRFGILASTTFEEFVEYVTNHSNPN